MLVQMLRFSSIKDTVATYMVHTCNPSTLGTEARRSGVHVSLCYLRLSQTKQKPHKKCCHNYFIYVSPSVVRIRSHVTQAVLKLVT